MASLLDIAPLRENVTIAGVTIEVRPVSAEAIVTLMQRFGNIFGLLAGSGSPAELKPAIGALLAAGVGELGNAAYEAKAAELPLGDQVTLLAAIRRLSMPAGVRPLVEGLVGLGLPLEDFLAALDQASTTSSPAASSS